MRTLFTRNRCSGPTTLPGPARQLLGHASFQGVPAHLATLEDRVTTTACRPGAVRQQGLKGFKVQTSPGPASLIRGFWTKASTACPSACPAWRPHAWSPVIASAHFRSSLDEGLARAPGGHAKTGANEGRKGGGWVEKRSWSPGGLPWPRALLVGQGNGPGLGVLATAPTRTVSSSGRRLTTHLPHQSEGPWQILIRPSSTRTPTHTERPRLGLGGRGWPTAPVYGPGLPPLSLLSLAPSRGFPGLIRLDSVDPTLHVTLARGGGGWGPSLLGSVAGLPTQMFPLGVPNTSLLLLSGHPAGRGWPRFCVTVSAKPSTPPG